MQAVLHYIGIVVRIIGKILRVIFYGPPIRFVGRLLKYFGRILKWIFKILVPVLVIGYFYVFRGGFLEDQIKGQFIGNLPEEVQNSDDDEVIKAHRSKMRGSIDLEVDSFSLLYGIEISNITIRSLQDYNHKPLLTLKKFVLDWNLPAYLVGDIGVHELKISGLDIFFEQGEKHNNWQRFLPDPFNLQEETPKGFFLRGALVALQKKTKDQPLSKAEERQFYYLLRTAIQYLETDKDKKKEFGDYFLSGLKSLIGGYEASVADGSPWPHPPEMLFTARPYPPVNKLYTSRNYIEGYFLKRKATFTNPNITFTVDDYLNLANEWIAIYEQIAAKWNQKQYKIDENNLYPKDLWDIDPAGDIEELKENLANRASDSEVKLKKLPQLPSPWLKTIPPDPESKNTNIWYDRYITAINPTLLKENIIFLLNKAKAIYVAGLDKEMPYWQSLWPLSFQILFHFELSDINLHYTDTATKAGLTAGMSNFTFRTIFLSKEISSIPRPPILKGNARYGYATVDFLGSLDELLDMIDTYLLELNPKENFAFYIKSKDKSLNFTPKDFKLNMRTYLDGASEEKHFQLKADIGQSQMPLVIKGSDLNNPGFKIEYDIQYDPVSDRLDIYNLRVEVLNRTWLRLKGQMKNVRYTQDTANPETTQFHFKLDQSDIDLTSVISRLNKLATAKAIPAKPMKAGGKLSIAPLEIKGSMKELSVKGKLSLDKFFFISPAIPISIPYFDLPYEAVLHPYKFLPKKKALTEHEPGPVERILRKKREGGALRLAALYAQEPSGEGDAEFGQDRTAPQTPEQKSAAFNKMIGGIKGQLGNIKFVNIGPIKGNINGAPLRIKLDLNEAKNFDFDFGLYGFPLSRLRTGPKNRVYGGLTLKMKTKGKSVFSQATSVDLDIKDLRYTLNYSSSGVSRFQFKTKTRFSAEAGGQRPITFNLDEFEIKHRNDLGRRGIFMQMTSKTSLNSDKLGPGNFELDLQRLKIDLNAIVRSLDAKNRESLVPQADRFAKPIMIKGKTNVGIGNNNSFDVKHDTFIETKVAGINANDLHLHADAFMANPNLITIRDVRFTGLKEAFGLYIKGTFRNKRGYKEGKPAIVAAHNIKVDFKFGSDKELEFDTGKTIIGWAKLGAQYKHPVVDGDFSIDGLSLDAGDTRLKNANMKFPIYFNLELHKVLNLTAGSKADHLAHTAFMADPNFTIDRIVTQIPLGGRKEKWVIFRPRDGRPGFQMRIELKDNVFRIPHMRIDMRPEDPNSEHNMLDGTITAHDILFNIGRQRTAEMEYKARLQIKDIDLKQFIPAQKRDPEMDGKIRMDLSLIGSRLDKPPLENLKLNMSIYKLGKEFGLMGLKVVNPKSNAIIDFGVKNSITVKTFDFDLVNGLVYAKVNYEKGFIGDYVAGPESNKIEQARMSLTEFLSRVRSEVSKYGTGEQKKAAPAQP